jgi:hypothetical protein
MENSINGMTGDVLGSKASEAITTTSAPTLCTIIQDEAEGGKQLVVGATPHRILPLSFSSFENVLLQEDSGIEGAYGPDVLLLAEDTNLIEDSDFAETGFAIFEFLDKGLRDQLEEGCRQLVRRKLLDVGIETPEDFQLSQYHKVVTQETHDRLIRSISIGMPASIEFPIDMKKIEELVSRHCRQPVVCYGNNFFLRLVRPGVQENNPFHRDVWLDRLRNLVNIYIPLAGSGPHSSLQIIPGSHLWKESEIRRTTCGARLNGRKFTVPACLGYTRRALPIRANPGDDQCTIFTPYLIHGNGTNEGKDTTRVSIEIRFEKAPVFPRGGSSVPMTMSTSKTTDTADSFSWPINLSSLGVGSVWFGVPWPPGKFHEWIEPTQQEVDAYLGTAINAVCIRREETLFIDTAAAYRGAEAKIGSYFDRHSGNRSMVLLGSKWGERYDPSLGDNVTDFSIASLHRSLGASEEALGSVDVLLTHLTSKITPEEALNVLRDISLEAELKSVRWRRVSGVKFVGVSISNKGILENALDEGLLRSMDILQVPAWLCRQQPELVERFVKQQSVSGVRKRHVLVNSPVRYRPEGMLPNQALTNIVDMPFVSVVLTGTRNHLADAVEAVLGQSSS